MKNAAYVFTLVLAMLSLSCSTLAQDAPEEKNVKKVNLLTIGNSFANNSTRFLEEIVAADPEAEIMIGKANLGGCSLERHWSYIEKLQENPEDPKGKPYNGKSLKEILEGEKWDVVTLQQLSYISTNYETYQPYADNLAAYIRKHAPETQIRIHQTWAYRADDPRFDKEDDSQEKMYAQLEDAYWKMADSIDARIIPVGKAFQAARNHPEWNYVYPDPDFDYKNPEYPNLPDQSHSLNAGYAWRKNRRKPDEPPKFGMDGHHANKAGEYLGGAVFFECLFDKSVVGNSCVPEGVSAEDVKFLQVIAHQTVDETEAAKVPPTVKSEN